MTCIISKRLCEFPSENHWELRDFSASLLAFICNKFNYLFCTDLHRYSISYPQLLSQVVKVLIESISDITKPLTSHYGALSAFCALGGKVVQTALLSNVANYVSLLKPELSSTNPEKKMEATKCYEKTMVAMIFF